MYQKNCDVAIIGGGPAGLAAAEAARKEGAGQVIIIERDDKLGGILQQCIHPGFGLNFFHEELTGPEYADRFEQEDKKLGVQALLRSMVLDVDPDAGTVLCVNQKYGVTQVNARSIVLAMGCREKTRDQIMTPGMRPAGIYTAGSAQRLINRQNILVGKKIVILGSGDIGMIMARRMTLEGAKVIAVVEIMDYLAGLTRNKVQCLDDFGIPLKLSHTITDICGTRRVEGVKVARVDENRAIIPGTEEYIPCDTLLLSVGLIPENELTRKARIEMNPITNGPVVNQYMQTSAKSVFACGNVVHVNDLVDNVSRESAKAGKYAAQYAMGTLPTEKEVVVNQTGANIRYLCPQQIDMPEDNQEVQLFFRVLKPDLDVSIIARSGEKVISEKKEKRINPGEMQSIKINTRDIENGELTVEIRK
jgi:NADPH-dependent 2,4-dienoyl-CoA reductase/sulfur reductase-like enzyme